jgi:hypothetical protein
MKTMPKRTATQEQWASREEHIKTVCRLLKLAKDGSLKAMDAAYAKLIGRKPAHITNCRTGWNILSEADIATIRQKLGNRAVGAADPALMRLGARRKPAKKGGRAVQAAGSIPANVLEVMNGPKDQPKRRRRRRRHAVTRQTAPLPAAPAPHRKEETAVSVQLTMVSVPLNGSTHQAVLLPDGVKPTFQVSEREIVIRW